MVQPLILSQHGRAMSFYDQDVKTCKNWLGTSINNIYIYIFIYTIYTYYIILLYRQLMGLNTQLSTSGRSTFSSTSRYGTVRAAEWRILLQCGTVADIFFNGQYSENSEQGILNGPILREKVAFQEHVVYFVSGLLGFNVEFGAPTRVL